MYETKLAEGQDELALEWLKEKDIHLITFTSSSTVTNLMEVLKRNGIDDPAGLLSGIPVASIGPVTSKTVKEAGLEVAIEAEDSTLDGLLQAIINDNNIRKHTTLGGRD